MKIRPGTYMRLKADLTLVLVTVIWGSAFAVMRVAAGHGSIFYLNGSRFLLGGVLLLPIASLRDAFHRDTLVYVLLAGFSLYIGVGLQQAGLATTTAGNAGFITSLNVVIVPLILWLSWKERQSSITWVAVGMAIAGAYLLSTGGGFRIQVGDLFIFFGSFFWALHIVVLSKVQGKMKAFTFAMGQFLVCGLLNLVTGLFVERPNVADMLAVIPAILYTGIFSIAIAFTLQVIAQKHTPANDAALILSLEAVFAALFGWLFLHEILLPIQIAGCLLILMAVVLVQVKNGKMRAL
jgi:drug/metabolite transporter (DMT)-like permease